MIQFTPEQKVLLDVFAKDLTYIIPEYQRPYSWDSIGKSDKNNQVNVMWQDLIEFYESNNPNIYFLGSMVVIGDTSQREYEVVDGQQRLTTLTLLFVSIKCFLQSLTQIDETNQQDLEVFIKDVVDDMDDLLFNKKKLGSITHTKKVKIERKIGFDYDQVLQKVIECGKIDEINLAEANEEQKQIAQRFFDNQKYFISKLIERFVDSNKFTYNNAQDLNKFIDFLKNRVTVIQIRCPSFDVAYQIFEILNNRGLPLSNKDLFRNFLISEFSELKAALPSSGVDPNQKWYHLENNYELAPEFLSRYVESKRGGNQQYSAFNDLQDIYKENFKDSLKKKKIENFYADIEKNLDIYTRITTSQHPQKEIRNRISFLLQTGNTRYITNFLMSLFRNIHSDEVCLDILKTFEKYILYIWLGSSKRFSSKPIYQAIGLLNNQSPPENILDIFKLNAQQTEELKNALHSDIVDNYTAKLIIARYLWAFDNLNTEDIIQIDFDYDRATLEHIIPQSPNPASNWLEDFTPSFRKEYTYKLGNMTLLTQKVNSAAKNYDFDRKKTIYSNTKLFLSNALSKIDKISEEDIKKRHQEIIDLLFKDLELS